MDATQPITTQMPPCGGGLSELQVPMINAMVSCLANEHRRLEELTPQLALAASRLASDPSERAAKTRSLEAWDEIRRELWSHLQIEDALIYSWAIAHHALSPGLLDTLRVERQQMRDLLSDLRPGEGRRAESNNEDPDTLAQTLSALAQHVDSHVERYDTEVLPAILRAVFHR
jgi:hemerythrin-like domain-containing protein